MPTRREFLGTGAALGASFATGSVASFAAAPPASETAKARAEISSVSARLIAAIVAGDAATVRELIEADPLLKSLNDERGRSLLWIASAAGRPEIFPILRADSSSHDIFDSVVTGDIAAINALYQADAAVLNERNPYGWTPLLAACDCGEGSSVETLVGIGAGLDARLPTGETPLLLALVHAKSAAVEWMVQILLGNGADPNIARPDGVTPLQLAIGRNHESSVRMLLRKGANPAGVDLTSAAPAIARHLRGAKPLTRDNVEPASRLARRDGGAFAVANPPGIPQVLINQFVTVAHANLDETKRLLRLCPDLVASRASWDELAVEGPAHLGNERNVLFLLEQGAPFSLPTATMLGELAEVRRLLAADARAALCRGPHDWGLIWYSAYCKPRVEIATLLLDAGADLHANIRGRSVMHEAAVRNHADLLEFLLARGADVNSRSVSRFLPGTPLAVALRRKATEAAEFLRSHGGVE